MQINVKSKLKDYTLQFTEKFNFFEELPTYSPRIVIIDTNVYTCYESLITQFFTAEEIVLFDAVESNKNMSNVLSLCNTVMEFSAKKNMTIISFGGGITQDITGFLASILYRGVNWIFIPTTLLAQADSCMGSKTSLNYGYFKNLLGSFYPPSRVYVDVNFTWTLSDADFYSGIGEIIKLHLMGGKEQAESIINQVGLLDLKRKDSSFLMSLVKTSLDIKYSYIKDDEFDTGKRNLLNYGHCFGHALESTSDYRIPHGLAVMIGILFANILAVGRKLLSEKTEKRLAELLLLPCIKCELQKVYFTEEAIVSAMKMDKKRVGAGLPLIVLEDSFELSKLTDVTPEEVYSGIDKLLTYLTFQ